MTGVEQQVADLACLSSGALRDRWRAVTASPVPRISPAMLRLALAWELQARAGGGLARDTTRALDQLAAAKTRTSPVSPGMRLVRAWAGKVHVVMIGDDGMIRWDDRDCLDLCIHALSPYAEDKRERNSFELAICLIVNHGKNRDKF